MKTRSRIWMLPLLFSGARLAFSAPVFADIEVQAIEAWNRQTTLRAAIRLETEIMGILVSGEGQVAVMRADGMDKYRQELTLRIPEPMAIEAALQAVFDGESLHLTRAMLDEKQAIQTEPGLEDAPPPPGGPLLFEWLRSQYTVTAVEDGELAGRGVWDIDCTPKDTASRAQPLRLSCDKETGLALRFEFAANDEAAAVTISITGIEIGPTLNPAAFVVPPPAAAEESAREP
ncbi:MAG TPA: hypothetical protein PKI11_10040 [Candidatus Hydrogenedentes bacterium]|nr:hypothetical protein [Candidatus Hydrogenedentota bacterium]